MKKTKSLRLESDFIQRINITKYEIQSTLLPESTRKTRIKHEMDFLCLFHLFSELELVITTTDSIDS